MISKIAYCTYNENIFIGTVQAEAIIYAYCKENNFKCYRLSDTKFTLYRVRRWLSLGQEITIDTEGGYWAITSRQLFPTFYDFSANFFNVRDITAFINNRFEIIESQLPIANAYEHTDDADEVTVQAEAISSLPQETGHPDLSEATVFPTEAGILSPVLDEKEPVPEKEIPQFLQPLAFVKNKPPYYGNFILMAAMILIYGLMIYSSYTGKINSAVIRSWGANHDLFVSNGEIYRLVTSIFIHASGLHLLGNLVVLYLIGGVIEKWLSSRYYIFHYISIGFFAAALSYYFNDATFILGASSANFGLLGLLLFALLTKQFPKAIVPAIIVIAGIITFDLALITLDYNKNIDHTGHLAGFSFGFIYGIIYDYCSRKAPFKENLKVLFAPLLTSSIAMIIVLLKPNEFKAWEQYMKKADLYYENASFMMRNYHIYENEFLLKEIDYALECFDQLDKTIDTLQHLSVPRGYKLITTESFKNSQASRDLLIYLRESVLKGSPDFNRYERELKALKRF